MKQYGQACNLVAFEDNADSKRSAVVLDRFLWSSCPGKSYGHTALLTVLSNIDVKGELFFGQFDWC